MASSPTDSGWLPVDWSSLDGVDLHARYFSECRGGDFFDALPVDERVLFLLTDIAGTRPNALEVAEKAQSVFRQKAQEFFQGPDVNESDAVAQLAHAVNLALIEAAAGVRFAPTFLGCFNATLSILTYCNAGSLLALFRDGGNVRALESTGMPLGLFTHTTFEAAILAFQPGDALLVATKGVTESSRGNEEFGVVRVETLLGNSASLSAVEICDAVLREAHTFANSERQILRFLQGGSHSGQQDLTALAVVNRKK
jgi:serine phosphatase RsbU (regulator of sigma subunit)